jgi:hypothetical protein
LFCLEGKNIIEEGRLCLKNLRNYKIKLFQRSVEILVDQSALYTTAQVS